MKKSFSLSAEYKLKVCASAYIGKKGYTIPKIALQKEDIETVKKELCMIPFSIGPKRPGNIVSFPVYRENESKLYLPRFYGEKRYGVPGKLDLNTGVDIDTPFVKDMRDYQHKIVGVYLNHVKDTSNGGGILEVPCGKGKCLAKGTLVRLFDGEIRKVEDIRVNDSLLGDDDIPRRVLSLASGRELMYRILEVGTTRSYTVNVSHILSLKNTKTGQIEDISIEDYLHREDKADLMGWRIPNLFYPQTYTIQIEPVGEGEYYGFTIDGNRRFVLGDYTVTHNTVMALNIISQIKKKTIILVHKEFLMNQWIERIEEFIPSARVGKIQATVFDIDDKDIVIGMIQTLYSRNFPAGTFDSFGLTVIDEVHRIGSEEFSKTLFSIVTPYMLGISATVERKDKLTKILYMFIGPKIYSEERTDDDIVQVRGLFFKSQDPTFNDTEYDYRGSPKYSSMITKLCKFGPRSDFIVTILSDLLKENPEKQIMVLAHNRELLVYLYEAIHHKISNEENTVGYYVGGMKEIDLKKTEGCRIVLATYAMAAEALDIKTLSTLVMATPKTDIEQSVGRILRAKGQNPIIVDIIDPHDYLKRQWNTRKAFYKKCRYQIITRNIEEYNGFSMIHAWRVDFQCGLLSTKKEERPCFINIPKEILHTTEV